MIGLSVTILASGIAEEHQIGHAFEEALSFIALLAVFFAIVAVIVDQGLLSMVSDNVFVGTVYITEIQKTLIVGQITSDQFDLLAVAITTGTNLPSVTTPNGQAAFLFLLTSALAPLIRLSYGSMVIMAFLYKIVLTLVGLLAISTGQLTKYTLYFYDSNIIQHHSAKPENITSCGHY
jgi:NhaB family Na+:H+ antiporter